MYHPINKLYSDNGHVITFHAKGLILTDLETSLIYVTE